MELAQKDVELVEKDYMTTLNMKSLCKDVISEGCVLLKNNDVLPLGNKRFALFGRCQINTFDVGYGSGGAVKAPYIVTLLDGFLNMGANLDLDLVDRYKSWCSVNPIPEGEWGAWPLCFPEMPLSEDEIKEIASKNDIAVVIIGRSAGEDRDTSLSDGAWYLNDEERVLLKNIRNSFKKVCVLINSGSIMDTNEILTYNPDALMYIWQGGQEMGNGVASVLLGEVSPSGKLTDTIALIENYPSTSSFGFPDTSYYYEDIFVGYRYFNTFKKDEIIYPFGYGLSYTKFNYEVLEVVKNDSKYNVKVSVKNIGNYSGKEVVQLYLSKPNGMFTNPGCELVSFCKTNLLGPNENEVVNLEFDLNEFTVFDDRLHRYILEEGKYSVSIGFDSLHLEEIHSFNLEEKITVKDSIEACLPSVPFKRMINLGGISYEQTPLKDIERLHHFGGNLAGRKDEFTPYATFDDVKDGKVSLDDFVNSLTLDELEALTRGSLYSMNSPFGPHGNTGTFGASTESLFDRGVPAISTNDGPSGVRMGCHSTKVPNGSTIASTFNPSLIEKLAIEIGKEVLERDSHVMLAPGINIHRNPLCGRNFEYYSEDPFLTAMIAAGYVSGIQTAGASACLKHFACNNQEYLRYNNDSVVSARALREIYVKAFELCIKRCKPDAVMTSYNKVNGEFAYYNYELVNYILRKEIGFDGLVMTDWWIRAGVCNYDRNLKTQAYRIRATVDLYMPGSRGDRDNPGVSDGTLVSSYQAKSIGINEIRSSAKRVLELCLKYKG